MTARELLSVSVQRVWLPIALSLVLLSITGCMSAGDADTTSSSSSEPTTTTTAARPSNTAARVATTTTAVPTTTSLVESHVEIRVESGRVVEGPERLEVGLGSDVRLLVKSDVADHVHIHGYDLFFDLGLGEEVEIEFVADIPGVFEVELEESGLLLLEIEVS